MILPHTVLLSLCWEDLGGTSPLTLTGFFEAALEVLVWEDGVHGQTQVMLSETLGRAWS